MLAPLRISPFQVFAQWSQLENLHKGLLISLEEGCLRPGADPVGPGEQLPLTRESPEKLAEIFTRHAPFLKMYGGAERETGMGGRDREETEKRDTVVERRWRRDGEEMDTRRERKRMVYPAALYTYVYCVDRMCDALQNI